MNDLIQQFGLEFVLTDIALKAFYEIKEPEQETEKQMVEK